MPPSEEGGGTAYKGLKRRDGRRDTPNMCESSRYRRELIYNDTRITLCTPTPWCEQQPRILSPSVAPLNPLGAPAPSSEGAEGAPAPYTYLIFPSTFIAPHHLIKMCRHWRRSKAKPLRGRRGSYRRTPQIYPCAKASLSKLHTIPNSTLFQIPHYSRLIAAHIQENSFYAT